MSFSFFFRSAVGDWFRWWVSEWWEMTDMYQRNSPCGWLKEQSRINILQVTGSSTMLCCAVRARQEAQCPNAMYIVQKTQSVILL